MSKPAILCVDDEIVVLDSLKIQLRNEFGDRYLYEVAESASEAMEILEEIGEETDMILIVSDWLMPEIKGDDFLIHVHEKYPNIIKVMLTGQADESAIERVKQQAALHRCLSKPWNTEELVETITSGLAKLS